MGKYLEEAFVPFDDRLDFAGADIEGLFRQQHGPVPPPAAEGRVQGCSVGKLRGPRMHHLDCRLQLRGLRVEQQQNVGIAARITPAARRNMTGSSGAVQTLKLWLSTNNKIPLNYSVVSHLTTADDMFVANQTSRGVRRVVRRVRRTLET